MFVMCTFDNVRKNYLMERNSDTKRWLHVPSLPTTHFEQGKVMFSEVSVRLYDQVTLLHPHLGKV